MLHTFYNIRKTLDSSGFPVILPNPNRITTIGKISQHRCEIFLYSDGASKARFRKGRYSAKNEASAQLKAAFALVNDGPRRKGKRSAAT